MHREPDAACFRRPFGGARHGVERKPTTTAAPATGGERERHRNECQIPAHQYFLSCGSHFVTVTGFQSSDGPSSQVTSVCRM